MKCRIMHCRSCGTEWHATQTVSYCKCGKLGVNLLTCREHN